MYCESASGGVVAEGLRADTWLNKQKTTLEPCHGNDTDGRRPCSNRHTAPVGRAAGDMDAHKAKNLVAGGLRLALRPGPE